MDLDSLAVFYSQADMERISMKILKNGGSWLRLL
jgi:hypothetical protein